MNKPLLLVLACVVLSATTASHAVEPRQPVPIIFDTDLGNDVDDVLALGMIHALESRGDCRLLAVTITKDNLLAGKFTDCVNTFYGRGDVAIGITKSGVTPADGKFTVLANQRDNNQLRYPHDFDPATADNAVTVLRRALASAEDTSVVIAQVGFSTNLANLLDSPADDISPLTGLELAKKKVKLISIMAGAFEKIPNNKGEPRDHLEYNVVKDLPAAQKLARDWPTPIVWSGYEVGRAVRYPAISIEQDYDYVTHHPLAEAYYLYMPPPHNRPSWDLTSVLYAILPDRGYFGVSPPGTVTVADDGLTTFTAQDAGKHRYLILSPEQQIRVTEALVQLSSQPPSVR
ncbi:MAG: nucleoside hydrolase [Planctomycetes bacterium]|nr:nucleoside hydrolase [Planctomycetota bacterium]